MKMRTDFVLTAFLAGATLLTTGPGMAAGFYLTNIGTPLSIGTVGVTNTVNNWGADAAWAQPAGMVDLEETSGGVTGVTGVTTLIPSMKFDSSVAEAGGSDGGNAGSIAAIPSQFLVKKLSDKTSVGLAITAPLGGAMDFGSDFVGRYAAYEVSLQGVGISTSVGYRVNKQLAVGGGVSFVYTQFEEKVAINLPGPAPDGRVKLDDLDDWGYQPFLGLTYAFSDRAMLGVVYRAEMDVDLRGDADFSGVPIEDGSSKVGWDNPQWLEASLRFNLDGNYFVAANLGWQDWSAFSENKLQVSSNVAVLDRKFEDTWRTGIAFGRFDGSSGWSTGVSYDSSPVASKDRTIDLPFDEQAQLGASYFVKDETLSYALGASVMYAGKGNVDQTAQGVRFKGDFETNLVYALGGTVRYTF